MSTPHHPLADYFHMDSASGHPIHAHPVALAPKLVLSASGSARENAVPVASPRFRFLSLRADPLCPPDPSGWESWMPTVVGDSPLVLEVLGRDGTVDVLVGSTSSRFDVLQCALEQRMPGSRWSTPGSESNGASLPPFFATALMTLEVPRGVGIKPPDPSVSTLASAVLCLLQSGDSAWHLRMMVQSASALDREAIHRLVESARMDGNPTHFVSTEAQRRYRRMAVETLRQPLGRISLQLTVFDTSPMKASQGLRSLAGAFRAWHSIEGGETLGWVTHQRLEESLGTQALRDSIRQPVAHRPGLLAPLSLPASILAQCLHPVLWPKVRTAMPEWTLKNDALPIFDVMVGPAAVPVSTPPFHHLLVIGTTGGGKSSAMVPIAASDAISGRTVYCPDAHGSANAAIVALLPDSIKRDRLLWCSTVDPRRLPPINPLIRDRAFSPQEQGELAALSIAVAWPTPMTHVQRLPLAAAFTVLVTAGIEDFMMMPRFLSDEDFRRSILNQPGIDEAHRRYFEEEYPRLHAMTASTLGQRVSELVLNPAITAIFGQGRALDFSKALEQGVVLLLDCPMAISPMASRFAAAYLMDGLRRAAFRQMSDIQRKPNGLTLAGEELARHIADPADASRFISVLEEGRKAGVRLIAIVQSRHSLPDDLMSTALTNADPVAFAVNPSDAAVLAPYFQGITAQDLVQSPRSMAWARFEGRTVRIRTRPMPPLARPEEHSYAAMDRYCLATGSWSGGMADGVAKAPQVPMPTAVDAPGKKGKDQRVAFVLDWDLLENPAGFGAAAGRDFLAQISHGLPVLMDRLGFLTARQIARRFDITAVSTLQRHLGEACSNGWLIRHPVETGASRGRAQYAYGWKLGDSARRSLSPHDHDVIETALALESGLGGQWMTELAPTFPRERWALSLRPDLLGINTYGTARHLTLVEWDRGTEPVLSSDSARTHPAGKSALQAQWLAATDDGDPDRPCIRVLWIVPDEARLTRLSASVGGQSVGPRRLLAITRDDLSRMALDTPCLRPLGRGGVPSVSWRQILEMTRQTEQEVAHA